MTSNSLGFYDLMNIAEQNSEQNARQAAQLKFPSFKPAGKNKKMDPKSAKLSESVKRFLMKKEEEKAREEEAARIKKQNLLELRSKDKKATRRVGAMLRMTKSANKSVIAEAKHSLSDALVDQGDTEQPDTDDYGYVSSSADAWHKKMMDKYKTIQKSKPVPRSETHYDVQVPEVHTLKDSRKDRDRDHGSSSSGYTPSKLATKEPEKKKVSAPPPLSFQELMAIADERNNNPENFVAPILKKPVAHRNQDNFEFGRPMTAQEKAEYLAEKNMKDKLAKSIKDGTFRLNPAQKDSNNNRATSKSVSPKTNGFKIPTKTSQKDSSSPILRTAINPSQKPSPSLPPKSPARPPSQSQPPPREKSYPSSSDRNRVGNGPKLVPSNSFNHTNGAKSARHSGEPSKADTGRGRVDNAFKKPSSTETSSRPGTGPLNREGNRDRAGSSFKKPPPIREQERSSPPPSKRPKTSASSAHHPNENKSRRPPTSEYSRDPGPRYLPPSRAPPPPKQKTLPPKGRQVIDSDEEEYDSEMDDFIDDSDVDPNQISAMIRAITGYDKRKYNYEPDDEPMETSAFDQMREEAQSLRIGMREDLEDMRMEEEEKRRKLEREKLKRKQQRR